MDVPGVSVTPAVGWSCPPLAVGGTGTQTCTIPTLAPLSAASFTLVVKVNSGTASGTVISNAATVSSSTTDPNSANNTASTTTVVGVAAELCARAGAITGTNQSDTLNGTAGDDIICGGNGRDTINGRGGNDVIFGQNGKDVLNGNEGNDSIMGGNGKDQITGGAGSTRCEEEMAPTSSMHGMGRPATRSTAVSARTHVRPTQGTSLLGARDPDLSTETVGGVSF